MNLITKTLGEICDESGGFIRTGPFGSQLHESDYSDDGTPVVMPKDIIEGKVFEQSVARVNKGHVERLSQHKLLVGDIVYGRRGDIGRQALITDKESGWLCGTGCLRITIGILDVDSKFLHYYLRDAKVIEGIAKQAVGATMPNLNTSILRSIPVSYPSLREQQKIVAILSAYDDLIENNTRRIQILEEMVQCIYEEWFVRFRFTRNENVKMVGSRMGEIPEGWEVRSVTQMIEFDPRTSVPREGLKPFVPMASLTENSMLIDTIESREGNSGSKFKNGDTLFARITPCLENGKTGFVDFLPNDDSVAFGSTEYIVLRSKTVTPEFVYLTARSDRFRQHAIKSMSGATGRQRVRVDSFNEYWMVQPDKKSLDRFSEIVLPIFKNVSCLAKKNRNLRRTRDLLLPKLISGELDVGKIQMGE